MNCLKRLPGRASKSSAVKVAASILNCDFLNLEQEIKAVQTAGIDALHLDVMDGHFVPNLSFGVPLLKSVRKITKLPIITHLMVIRPEEIISQFIDDSDGIIFHIEATKHPLVCLKQIHQARRLAGIALNPNTPVKTIFKYLNQIAEVLVMSVYPGFGGQTFLPQSLARIRSIKKQLAADNPKALIAVDGGVNAKNAPSLIEAGIDILVAGTAIFHTNDYAKAIKKLRCSN